MKHKIKPRFMATGMKGIYFVSDCLTGVSMLCKDAEDAIEKTTRFNRRRPVFFAGCGSDGVNVYYCIVDTRCSMRDSSNLLFPFRSESFQDFMEELNNNPKYKGIVKPYYKLG